MRLAVQIAALTILLVTRVALAAPYHSADRDEDNQISTSELLRCVQLYHAGAYHCLQGTEDGYAPGDGARACGFHDSDYAPEDGTIDLGELLRAVQLHNALSYRASEESEDGYDLPPLSEPWSLVLTSDTLNASLGSVIVEAREGGFIVGGRGLGYSTDSEPGMTLMRIGPDGDVRWVTRIGASGDDQVKSIVEGPDGAIYFAGHHSPLLLPKGITRVLVGKLAANGAVEWICYLQSDSYPPQEAYTLDVNQHGDLTLIGHLEPVPEHEIYMARLSTSGELLWVRPVVTDGYRYLVDATQTAAGNFALLTRNLNTFYRLEIIVVDSDGGILWDNSPIRLLDSNSLSLKAKQDGGFLLSFAPYESSQGQFFDVYELDVNADIEQRHVLSSPEGLRVVTGGYALPLPEGGFIVSYQGYDAEQEMRAGPCLMRVSPEGDIVKSRDRLWSPSYMSGDWTTSHDEGAAMTGRVTHDYGIEGSALFVAKTNRDFAKPPAPRVHEEEESFSIHLRGVASTANTIAFTETQDGFTVAGANAHSTVPPYLDVESHFHPGSAMATISPNGYLLDLGNVSDDSIVYRVTALSSDGHLSTHAHAGWLENSETGEHRLWAGGSFGANATTFGHGIDRTPGRSEGHAVFYIPDSQRLAAGWHEDEGSQVRSVHILVTTATDREVWSTADSTPGFEEAYAIQADPNQGYVLAGNSGAAMETAKAALFHFGEEGTFNWRQSYANTRNGHGLTPSGDGGWFVICTADEAAGSKACLVRIDSSGEELWRRTYGASSDAYGDSVALTSDGALLIGIGDDNAPILLKTDLSGDVLWELALSGTGAARDVMETQDGHYAALTAALQEDYVCITKVDKDGRPPTRRQWQWYNWQ